MQRLAAGAGPPGPRSPSRMRDVSPIGREVLEETQQQQQQQQQQSAGSSNTQEEFMGQQLAGRPTAGRRGENSASSAAGGTRRPKTEGGGGKRQGKQKTRQLTAAASDHQAAQDVRPPQQHLRHANSEAGGSIHPHHHSHHHQPLKSSQQLVAAHDLPTNNGPPPLSLSSTTSNKKQVKHQDFARPQSALAGSACLASSNQVASHPQTAKVRRDSAGAIPNVNSAAAAAAASGGGLRPKTTRVRINSTSEQIQDPNWLIRMSKELEQPQPKKSHLKTLHRKLKSTITGTNSSSNSQLQPDDPALPPSVPATPIKQPVSILKQRGQPSAKARGRLATISPQQQQQQPQAMSRQPRAAGGGRHAPSAAQPASNAQVASTSSSSSSQLQNPSHQIQQHGGKLANELNNSPTNHPSALIDRHHSQKKSPQQNSNSAASSSTGSGTSNRPEPICAEGQVKVSGWKRNNLLAKTLSHLDEIRGNQRPVFVPTKIRLPAAEVTQSSASQQAVSRSPSPSSSKFADIVREAMATKRSDQLSVHHHHHHHQPAIKRTSDGECKPDQQQTGSGGHRSNNEQMIVRAVSADPTSSSLHLQAAIPTTGSGGLQPNTSGSSQHQQQHRSSSAGLTSNQGKQQQVIVSLNNWGQIKHNGGGSAGHGISSPGSSPIGSRSPVTPTVVTPHLMNQLLSVSAHQSSQLLESGSSSTRQFKLQHKNHQVLQNLRRQSNELQASLNAAAIRAAAAAAAAEETGSPSKSSPSGGGSAPGRTKDWKRLAGKLGLLTGGNSKHTLGIPRSPLGSLSGGDNNTSGQSPLRLTVSNQETGDNRLLQKRGSGQQPQGNLMVPGQTRRLSSSSMVVEPPKGGGGAARGGSGAGKRGSNSPRLSATDLELMAQVTGPRRKSDSEAYRMAMSTVTTSATAAITGGLIMRSPTVTSAGGGSSPAGETVNGDQETVEKMRPVVVHRNDLLQLLQVTGSSTPQQPADGGRQKVEARRSLQLTVDQLPVNVIPEVAAKQENNHKTGSDNSLSSNTVKSWCEGEPEFEATRLTSQRLARRSSSVKSLDELIISTDTNRKDLPADTSSSKCKNQKLQNGTTPPEVTSKRKTDLSWVVKKTSKVVFFHEKLRKMRWNKSSKTAAAAAAAAAQQQATDESKLETSKPEAAIESSQGSLKEKEATAGGGGGSDVFMDPTLIGDAIEIFLRSAMQQQPSPPALTPRKSSQEDTATGETSVAAAAAAVAVAVAQGSTDKDHSTTEAKRLPPAATRLIGGGVSGADMMS